jgi:hypothetical protein
VLNKELLQEYKKYGSLDNLIDLKYPKYVIEMMSN